MVLSFLGTNVKRVRIYGSWLRPGSEIILLLSLDKSKLFPEYALLICPEEKAFARYINAQQISRNEFGCFNKEILINMLRSLL